jgi:hypothetical protein
MSIGWSFRSWCQEGGTLRIDLGDTHLDFPASGRCDAPGSASTLE